MIRQETIGKKDVKQVAAIIAVSAVLGSGLGVLLNLEKLDFDPSGHLKVDDIEYNNNVMTLNTGCHSLTMGVSKDQIQAIKDSETNYLRPMTHDLIIDIVNEFERDVEAVVIYNMEDGSYISNLIVDDHIGYKTVDSRPSDAIAVAARTESPIYLRPELVYAHGEFICEGTV